MSHQAEIWNLCPTKAAFFHGGSKGRIDFLVYSDCWQNSNPCDCRTEVLFSFLVVRWRSFTASRGCPYSLAHGPSLYLQDSNKQQVELFTFQISLAPASIVPYLWPMFLISSSIFKDWCDYIGSMGIIQNNLFQGP